MDELLQSDKELEILLQSLNCEDDIFCGPPPVFGLPPPPIPPMLDSFPDCMTMQGSCDNMPEVTSITSVQDIFHSIIIIIVSSVIIVMSIILLAVLTRKYFIKNSISKDVFLNEIYQNGISNIKEVEPAPRTLQNYYVSDPQIKLKKSDQAVLSSTISMHHIPTVVINGIPFHNFHKVNILSDSSILNAENGPIYETLDDDYYSEISNTESDILEVGSRNDK